MIVSQFLWRLMAIAPKVGVAFFEDFFTSFCQRRLEDMVVNERIRILPLLAQNGLDLNDIPMELAVRDLDILKSCIRLDFQNDPPKALFLNCCNKIL